MNEAVHPTRYTMLLTGDPVPWFAQRSSKNPRFHFHIAAGRYIVLCFYGSAGDPQGQGAIEAAKANRRHFDDVRASFFGVSIDPRDESEGRVRERIPGIRFFWDFDGQVSRLYGAAPKEPQPDGRVAVRRFWMVLDPTLRVLAVFPFMADGREREQVFAFLDGLPPPERFAGFEVQAPVLILPNVFEPEFCRHLIGLYEKHGGRGIRLHARCRRQDGSD